MLKLQSVVQYQIISTTTDNALWFVVGKVINLNNSIYIDLICCSDSAAKKINTNYVDQCHLIWGKINFNCTSVYWEIIMQGRWWIKYGSWLLSRDLQLNSRNTVNFFQMTESKDHTDLREVDRHCKNLQEWGRVISGERITGGAKCSPRQVQDANKQRREGSAE